MTPIGLSQNSGTVVTTVSPANDIHKGVVYVFRDPITKEEGISMKFDDAYEDVDADDLITSSLDMKLHITFPFYMSFSMVTDNPVGFRRRDIVASVKGLGQKLKSVKHMLLHSLYYVEETDFYHVLIVEREWI